MMASITTACLALLGWRWQRRRNVVPIQAWATREIAIVRRRARDRVRTHAELQTDLIEVLRQYVTERFGIDAKTMSNRELATSLRETAGISGGLIASLTPIFDVANRARFAGKNDDDPESTAIDRECDTLQVFVDNASSMLTSQERV